MPSRPVLEQGLPILELLTLRTRIAAYEHPLRFEELYPANGTRVPNLFLALEKSAYLVSQRLTIRMPVFEVAIFVWQPGDEAPDEHALANQLAARAYASSWISTRLYWATRKAEAITGGLSGINRQPLQAQHDLGTTAAYLKCLAQNPIEASNWFGEDILPRDFRAWLPHKRPDAAVLGEDGWPKRLIEIGGLYSPSDLRHIHRNFSRLGVRYEIW